jgi:hypothetical protein
MSLFRDHPCFARKGSGINTIGAACRRLSDVLAAFPEAQEARRALGDPFNPIRAREALTVLTSLPAKTQARIIAADEGKRA